MSRNIAMVLTDVVHVRKARLSRTTDWNNDFEVGAHDPSAVERLPSATAKESKETRIR